MTVKELIEELGNFGDNLEVQLCFDDENCDINFVDTHISNEGDVVVVIAS